MPLVNPQQSNAGDLVTASAINTPVNQLAAVLNGGIDATNIADGAVGTSEIATAAVTAVKLGLPVTSATNTGTAGGTFNYTTIGTIKLLWGLSVNINSTAGATITATVIFPSGFFTGGTTPYVYDTASNDVTTAQQFVYSNAISSTSCQLNVNNISGGAGIVQHSYLVIGS